MVLIKCSYTYNNYYTRRASDIGNDYKNNTFEKCVYVMYIQCIYNAHLRLEKTSFCSCLFILVLC